MLDVNGCQSEVQLSVQYIEQASDMVTAPCTDQN